MAIRVNADLDIMSRSPIAVEVFETWAHQPAIVNVNLFKTGSMKRSNDNEHPYELLLP